MARILYENYTSTGATTQFSNHVGVWGFTTTNGIHGYGPTDGSDGDNAFINSNIAGTNNIGPGPTVDYSVYASTIAVIDSGGFPSLVLPVLRWSEQPGGASGTGYLISNAGGVNTPSMMYINRINKWDTSTWTNLVYVTQFYNAFSINNFDLIHWAMFCKGTTIGFKMWKEGDPEPSLFITATDSSNPGTAGVIIPSVYASLNGQGRGAKPASTAIPILTEYAVYDNLNAPTVVPTLTPSTVNLAAPNPYSGTYPIYYTVLAAPTTDTPPAYMYPGSFVGSFPNSVASQQYPSFTPPDNRPYSIRIKYTDSGATPSSVLSNVMLVQLPPANIVIVAAGDITVHGNNTTGGMDPCTVLQQLLSAMVAPATVTVYNAGIDLAGGASAMVSSTWTSTTTGNLPNVISNCLAHSATDVHIMLGSSDANARITPQAFYTNMTTMINLIQSNCPTVKKIRLCKPVAFLLGVAVATDDVQMGLLQRYRGMINALIATIPGVYYGGDGYQFTAYQSSTNFSADGYRVSDLGARKVAMQWAQSYIDTSQTSGGYFTMQALNDSTVRVDLTQPIPNVNITQSIGDSLNAARAQGFGSWFLNPTTKVLTLFAADGVTPVRTFNIDSVTAPLQRS